MGLRMGTYTWGPTLGGLRGDLHLAAYGGLLPPHVEDGVGSGNRAAEAMAPVPPAPPVGAGQGSSGSTASSALTGAYEVLEMNSDSSEDEGGGDGDGDGIQPRQQSEQQQQPPPAPAANAVAAGGVLLAGLASVASDVQAGIAALPEAWRQRVGSTSRHEALVKRLSQRSAPPPAPAAVAAAAPAAAAPSAAQGKRKPDGDSAGLGPQSKRQKAPPTSVRAPCACWHG